MSIASAPQLGVTAIFAGQEGSPMSRRREAEGRFDPLDDRADGATMVDGRVPGRAV